MAEIGPDFRGGYYGEQIESSGGGWDPSESNKSKGPLSKLYDSSIYDFNSRYYPRDIGTSTRGHYINFYINVSENSMYNESNGYRYVEGFSGRTAQNQSKGNTVTAYDFKDLINSGVKSTGQFFGVNDVPQIESKITLARRTKRITQAVSLYMPETVNVQYNVDWQSQSLTDAGGLGLMFGQAGKGAYDAYSKSGSIGDTLKSIATDRSTYGALLELVGKGAESSVLGQGATDFLLYATGQALNPQLEVLFKGVDMRTFQFDFLFAPFDEDEAKNVVEIVKTFKFHMAPEINKGMMGRYFTPPSEFDIDFLFNGQKNPHVHQIGTCVLQNVNVDYAPNGWSTFNNGMPTHIRMTLQFMETEIVTKQRVDEGY